MAFTANSDPTGRVNEYVLLAEGEGMFCTHDVTLATQEELIARLVVKSHARWVHLQIIVVWRATVCHQHTTMLSEA